MGEKEQKTGSNRTNIGERSEAPLGALRAPILFFAYAVFSFLPPPLIRIKPGPRITEGKIYVAVFCVYVNGDIKRVSSGGWKRALLFRKCDVCCSVANQDSL